MKAICKALGLLAQPCRGAALAVSVGALCLCAAVTTASAATLTYNFTGSVTQVSTGTSPIAVGQVWTGSFTFETQPPDTHPFIGPPSASYAWYFGALSGLRFDITTVAGAPIYSATASDGDLQLLNDYSSTDQFWVYGSPAKGLVGAAVGGLPLTEAYIRLLDLSHTALNTALTLPTALILSQFTNGTLNLYFRGPGCCSGSALVYGSIDTLTLASDLAAVPVPAALPLFATGLGLMGLLSWRRKRKRAAVAD